MKTDELLGKNREQILKLGTAHGVFNVRLFGSVARGDFGKDSDIDLLVDIEKGRTFLDLVAFWQDVEELLGCSVDVITDGGISPYLRERIQSEAHPL